MIRRTVTAVVTASMLALQCAPSLAYAENPMGYRLLSVDEASRLPRHQGALGIDVERANQITNDGMTFDILRVKQVRQGSPGAQAGFQPGDQIIALNGRVFPSLAAFAAYVGSMAPGTKARVDYIPAGNGPADAARVTVTVGAAGRSVQSSPQYSQGNASTGSAATGAAATGMSTRTKIGLAAAALLGCYELGCFSHKTPSTGSSGSTQYRQQPYGAQQR